MVGRIYFRGINYCLKHEAGVFVFLIVNSNELILLTGIVSHTDALFDVFLSTAENSPHILLFIPV